MKDILLVFAHKRMLVVLLMGFASGIPLALTGSTLQAWMTTQHVDLSTIGLFALVGMPYALKFLWAPLVDQWIPPFLGRRRGWLILMQLPLVLAIAAMAFTNPAAQPVAVAILGLLVSFFSASQDIIVDAYRREILTETEFGAGSGLYVMGYRVAMVISGAFAFILADHMDWKHVYLIMAAVMTVGIATTFFADEPKAQGLPPRTLKDAVVLPFVDYFSRSGSIAMLVFMVLYKLDVAMTMAMTTPFMLGLGFSKTEIGTVSKLFGMIATIVGALLGGGWMVRLGIKRSLWIFGIAQALSGFTYMALAYAGHNYPVMVGAITIENLCSGMGIAAFSAFMLSLCNPRFSGTQYALLTSFMALSRYLAGAMSGFLVEAVGWQTYFLLCALAGIPGLLLLTQYSRWNLKKN